VILRNIYAIENTKEMCRLKKTHMSLCAYWLRYRAHKELNWMCK